MFEEILVYGTLQGLILALLALGFSLVYGVGGILNLAHGSFYLITCYVFIWTVPILGIWGGIVMGLIVVVLVAAFTYLVLIKPLQGTPVGVVLVTFAWNFFFIMVVNAIMGNTPQGIQILWDASFEFLGVKIGGQHIILIVGSIILLTLVILFIKKTKLGKSIQAVSQDKEAAELMGINTSKIFLTTVIISAILAGSAVFLNSGDTFSPMTGWTFLLNAYAVTILGGMGSIMGSILGAFIMGYAITFTQFYPALGPEWGAVVPIIVIVIMLLIRPRGLLGKKEVQ